MNSELYVHLPCARFEDEFVFESPLGWPRLGDIHCVRLGEQLDSLLVVRRPLQRLTELGRLQKPS